MLNTAVKVDPQKEIDAAYQIVKLHAATDGAFHETLMRHWFEAAWAACADFTGFIYPPQQVRESVMCDEFTGQIKLSGEPSGPVKIYAGAQYIGTLPGNARVFGGSAPSPMDLCCYCNLMVEYQVGEAGECGRVPASFVQAVARVFAYICENRGDVEMDPQILSKSGAIAFLDVVYIL
jgi:hypothetical protein